MEQKRDQGAAADEVNESRLLKREMVSVGLVTKHSPQRGSGGAT